MTMNGQAKTSHITVTAAGDGTREPSPAADLHMVVSYSGDATSAVSGEADVRFLNNIFYVRATKLPPIPLIDPATIANKWFSIDFMSLLKQYGNQAQSSQFLSTLNASSKMPAEFYEKEMALAQQTGVVSSVTAKGSEKIGSTDTRVYAIGINVSKISDFMNQFTDLYNSYLPKDATPMVKHEFTQAEKDSLANVSVNNVQVWIGKNDYLPYRVTANVTSTIPETTGTNSSGTVAFSFVINTSDYNKQVTVAMPEASTPIEQFLSSMFGGTLK
jgi:hypothetical protein